MATFKIVYDPNGRACEQPKIEEGKKKGEFEVKIINDSEQPIYIKVYHYKPKLFRIGTLGVKIQAKYWDPNKKKVKAAHPKAVTYNAAISNAYSSLVTQHANAMESDGFWDMDSATVSTAKSCNNSVRYFDEYWQLYVNELKGEQPSLLSYIEDLDAARKDLSWSRIKDLQSSLNRFKKFKTNVTWSQLKVGLLRKYEAHLNAATYTKKGKEIKLHETRKKDLIDDFRAVYYNAIRDEFLDTRDNIFTVLYQSEFAGAQHDERRDLEPFEVNKFIEYKIHEGKPELQVLQDGFALMCMTGLGPGDLARVDESWVEHSPGTTRLVDKRSKTKVRIDLPVSALFDGKPLQILNKHLEGNKKPWNITNQYFNREIKKIAYAAGLNKPDEITLYVARHTFANLLIDAGVDLPFIQKLLAHTKISTTQIYTKFKKRTVDKAIKAVDWFQLLRTQTDETQWEEFKNWAISIQEATIPAPNQVLFNPKIKQAIITWPNEGQLKNLVIQDSPPSPVESPGNTVHLFRYQEMDRHFFTFLDNQEQSHTYADIPKEVNQKELDYLATKFLRSKLIS